MPATQNTLGGFSCFKVSLAWSDYPGCKDNNSRWGMSAISKVKKNRDDLKELCGTAMEIMGILQDRISLHGATGAVKLKSLCEDFERFLRDMIHGIEKMQKKPEGLRAHIKEFVKSSSVQDQIAGYQKKIQEICSRLKVGATNSCCPMILISGLSTAGHQSLSLQIDQYPWVSFIMFQNFAYLLALVVYLAR
ncbi:hypothetical protein B0H14DRAFT_3139194 [Mycena olivaceomarginata]|nr:hypothetical protein B0H14DRAFT_3139194 [Mycena olivaceomarginata]